MENDPNSPAFIWARSPNDHETIIRLAMNRAWNDSLASDKFTSSLAQYAGHIHGFVLHAQDGEFVSQKVSNGLMAAHAVFCGLKRNLIDYDLDKRRHVYVINPVRDYGYGQPMRGQCGHVAISKPLDAVFAVYVEFDGGAVQKATEWYGEILPKDVVGVIHKWEWLTPLDPTDETLPANFGTRYDERLW